jgi:hypothetical protein
MYEGGAQAKAGNQPDRRKCEKVELAPVECKSALRINGEVEKPGTEVRPPLRGSWPSEGAEVGRRVTLEVNERSEGFRVDVRPAVRIQGLRR